MDHISPYEIVLTFGKYKGYTLGSVKEADPNYLSWMSQSETMSDDWRIATTKLLNNESIPSTLSLPKLAKIQKQSTAKGNDKKKPVINLIKKGKASVTFPYNPQLLAMFKSQIESRKWNDTERYWEINVVHIPSVIKLFGGPDNVDCSEDVKKSVITEIEKRKKLDEIRIQDDSDFFDNSLLKRPLYGYQKVGVDFICHANERALIADEMGLGKSCQAIAFTIMRKYKTLIICPNSVKINWSREIEFFTGKKCCIWYADRKEGHGNSMFHIINYDIVNKFSTELRDIGFDLMVCDECTEIKNKKAKRTKSILGDYSQRRKYPGIKTKAVLLLTGTPVMNRPSEIFTFLNFLDKEKWPNYFAFTQKYGGWMGSPPRNLNLLHESIKDVVIRRRKDQIKSDLPEKLPPRNMYVELSDFDKKEYINLLKKVFSNWRESKPGIGTMPPINKFLIEKKLPRIMEMIDSFIEEGRSVTIFCTMLDPLFKLKEKYGDIAGLLYGDMSPEERQVTIDGIATGKLKIGLISLRAGKMGINGLQHGCDTAIMVDQWWDPSTHVQAEDRLHRNGQKNKVQIFYMLCADTIDEDMRELLEAKQTMIDTVVDGSIVTQSRKDSIFSQFVQRMKFKYRSEF